MHELAARCLPERVVLDAVVQHPDAADAVALLEHADAVALAYELARRHKACCAGAHHRLRCDRGIHRA